ncbi:hypothetical protein [Nocardiopsis metallicus]|uniref:IrrE N-terminal-like domain-containing protein n=1 Tax=Nocardiopsis metallicus TaxID=179819 RepID=A0A840WMP5_9ACTN|nr:hypothetical protein [Nocardiopsis metallicus]MBB5491388.1 hypothetical protein [Nocardiopsis metallicus]
MTDDPLRLITWPDPITIESLGQAIGDLHGLRVVVEPIPSRLRHAQVTGLVVVVGEVAHVYYDDDLPPLNRLQAVMHEYAHILHHDVVARAPAVCARTTFSDPKEARAEVTGMELLAEVRLRRKRFDVLDFLGGADRRS